MILTLLLCWLGWVALNVAGLLLAPRLAGDRAGAFTNGLQIVIPAHVQRALTDVELLAIMEHEHGHMAHRHAFKNLARACLFMPRPAALAQQQELEADDFAASRGHSANLASALRKLSPHPFDLERAERLEAKTTAAPAA